MIKRVAAINDLSGFGKCSLTAAIPVLAAMGVQACPLPTAILSNQTGYDSYYIDDYTSHMEAIMDQWEKQGFTFHGIYSGFLSGSSQVDQVLTCIDRFGKRDTLILVDPVLGDDGEPYKTATPELVAGMKELAAHADVITPNLTEACILTGTDYRQVQQLEGDRQWEALCTIADRLVGMGIETPVITGIRHRDEHTGKKSFYNFFRENGTYAAAETSVSDTVFQGSYSGTGDLFASVICGGLIRGRKLSEIVPLAADFIRASVEEAWKNGTDRNDGVAFEPYLFQLKGEQEHVASDCRKRKETSAEDDRRNGYQTYFGPGKGDAV